MRPHLQYHDAGALVGNLQLLAGNFCLLAELQERKADAEATGEVLDNFIQTLQEIGDMVTEFDDSLWAGLVESVTVYGKEEATFLFKGGTEIRVKKSD